MDKILSKDTIKNVFAALGAKTSDSNYGVALLDKTSGEPKGFMGMSDLASVLGGATIYCKTGDDVNNYDNGNYSCHLSSIKNTMSNLPEGLSDSDFEIISRKVEMYKYQQLIGQTNNTLYQRTYKGNAWTEWIRVDNYGTSSLSDLASLLGVIPFNWGNITSLDDIKVTSVWRVGGISVTTNAKTYNNTYGICLTLRNGGTSNWYLFQMYFAFAEYKLFVRGKSSFSDTIDWTDIAWKEVAFA